MKYLIKYKLFENQELKTWIITKPSGKIMEQSDYFHDILQMISIYVPRRNKDDYEMEAEGIADGYYAECRDQVEINEDDNVDEMEVEYDQKQLDKDVGDMLDRNCTWTRRTKSYTTWHSYRVMRKDMYELEFDMKEIGLL